MRAMFRRWWKPALQAAVTCFSNESVVSNTVPRFLTVSDGQITSEPKAILSIGGWGRCLAVSTRRSVSRYFRYSLFNVNRNLIESLFMNRTTVLLQHTLVLYSYGNFKFYCACTFLLVVDTRSLEMLVGLNRQFLSVWSNLFSILATFGFPCNFWETFYWYI